MVVMMFPLDGDREEEKIPTIPAACGEPVAYSPAARHSWERRAAASRTWSSRPPWVIAGRAGMRRHPGSPDQPSDDGDELHWRHWHMQNLGGVVQQQREVLGLDMPGDDHGNRQFGLGPAHPFGQIQAAHAGEIEIGEDQIPGLRPDAPYRRDGIGDVDDVEAAPLAENMQRETHHCRVMRNGNNSAVNFALPIFVHVSTVTRPGGSTVRYLVARRLQKMLASPGCFWAAESSALACAHSAARQDNAALEQS
ncbi:MAG TPA: hypothetical protein VK162_25740 [Streptosporangiaceae bacterium]|nr:hypothetical protein [Streptosporangiaceae bacterium]